MFDHRMIISGDFRMEKCACHCIEDNCSIINYRIEYCCPKCTYFVEKKECIRFSRIDQYQMIKDLKQYRNTKRVRSSDLDFLDAF